MYGAGDAYEGGWKDGLEHGVGTFIAADGSTYYGAWKSGQLHGQGVYKPAAAGNRRYGTLLWGVKQGACVARGCRLRHVHRSLGATQRHASQIAFLLSGCALVLSYRCQRCRSVLPLAGAWVQHLVLLASKQEAKQDCQVASLLTHLVLGPRRAEVVFMREYKGGALLSEQVLRVAEKDVRKKRKEKKKAKKQGGFILGWKGIWDDVCRLIDPCL